MSMFNYNDSKASAMENAVAELRQMMSEHGAGVVNQAFTETVLSMESAQLVDKENLEQTASGLQTQLEAIFGPVMEEMGLGMEGLTTAQLEAGVVAALAAGNPLKYAQAALNTEVTPDGKTPIVGVQGGSNGTYDFRDAAASMESFDEAKISEMIPMSVAFNVQAARQDEFAETFYPTTVVSPENGGMDITVDYTTVMNYTKRKANGDVSAFNQVNLLEAAYDHTVLEDESTAIVPFMNPDNSADDKFVDAALVAPRDVVVSGVDVRTSALKIGQEVDVLGVSSHPGLLNAGVLDNTDSIHPRIVLKTLYFANTVGSDTEVFKFDVSRLPSNAFIDSIEGHQRSMLLNFQSDALIITPETKLIDGSEGESNSEARTADYTIRLGVAAFGNANVEFGTLSVNSGGVKVVSIVDANGEQISTASGAGEAMANKLASMTLIGYEVEAARTNTNRRTRGLMLNATGFKERFSIPLGAPISMPSPVGSDRDTKDLQSLVVAANMRNTSNAVTTLLNYRDMLKAYVDGRNSGLGELSIEGIARHVVVPFYYEMDLDMADSMNSIRAKDRAEDVSATLINTIRDLVYRMLRESRYQTALDASNTGSKKPAVIIGTDSVIQRHLMVEGDTRTLGVSFEDTRIVHSVDARMRDKIVITFTRGSAGNGSVDPLSFGTHAWIPELTSSMTVTRDGATVQEAMVQPRNRHINNLPIMAVINVSNLKEVMSAKIEQPAQP